ncbi:MAG: hypothetical protein GQ565_02950 [Candidatus Aegiribacteria sp.]|nr:hypothetical protein [Candidatus Aegiribacteria sp.]
MEAGEKAPYDWAPSIPGSSGERAKTIMGLRRKARGIYKLSDAESLEARKGGALGMLTNIVGETIPQFGLSVVASILGGPAGVVSVSAMAGGEEVYQNLIDLGVDPGKANTARWVTAPIIGLVEKWQIDGILKISNKAAVKKLVQAARERAFKKMALIGADISFEAAIKATGDGLQEVLQEGTVIGAEVALGRELDLRADATRLGASFMGGVVVGETLRGAGSAGKIRGVVKEAHRQDAVDHLRRDAVPGVPPAGPVESETPVETVGISEQVPTEPPQLSEQSQEAMVGAPGTAFRNADLRAQREAMGMPPAPEMAPRGTTEERRQQAIQEGWGEVEKARAVAATILENPRPASDLESHGMHAALDTLGDTANSLEEQMAAHPANSVEFREVEQQWKDARRDYQLINQIGQWSGTEWGHAGHSRKKVLNDNGNVFSVLARVKASTGKDVDPHIERGLRRSVRKLRKDRQTSVQAVQRDTKNHMRHTAKKITKLGRLAKMTTAEKDAELQGLLGREQTELVLTDIFMNLASRDSTASIDSVIAQMRKYLPNISHTDVVDAFDRARRRKAKNAFGLESMLRRLRGQLKKEKNKLTSIDDVLYWLKQGRLPDATEVTPDIDDRVVRDLQVVLNQVTKLRKDSEPQLQRNLEKKIAYLSDRLAFGDFTNKPQALAFKPSNRTLDLQYQAAKLDSEIGRRISRAKAKTQTGPLRRFAANVARSSMSMKSSFDNSGLLNQGGFVALGHPIMAIKTIPKAISAALSDKRAFRINQEILNRPNAPLYQKYGLGLTRASEANQFTEREEEHRESLADFVPGIMASNRAFATTLNILRADSFDAMAGAFARNSGLTDVDGQAITDFINIATGRGNIRGLEGTMRTLNGVLWAPRRTLSRFQMIATLGGQLEWSHRKGESRWKPEVHLRGSRHVRRLMAQEVARYIMGVTAVQALGWLMGAEFEWDPLSSDFMKQKYGNLRIDPMSGFAQMMTIGKRFAYQQRKDAQGNIQDLSGYDMDRLVQRFVRYKLSPALGIAWSGISGQTPFDGPFTWGWAARETVTPISLDDVLKAADDQGIPRGIIFSGIGFFGAAVQVYGDNTSSGGSSKVYDMGGF